MAWSGRGLKKMDTIRMACLLAPVGGEAAMTLGGWSELVIVVSVIRRRPVFQSNKAGRTGGATEQDRISADLGVSHGHA